MRIRLLTIAFAIAMLLGVGTARAQSISGTLTDATSGLPLGNFLTFVYGVQAFDANGQVVGTAFTLQNGLYQIDVPAGTVLREGFRTRSLLRARALQQPSLCAFDSNRRIDVPRLCRRRVARARQLQLLPVGYRDALPGICQFERSGRLSRDRHHRPRRGAAHHRVDGHRQPRRGGRHRQPLLQRLELGTGHGSIVCRRHQRGAAGSRRAHRRPFPRASMASISAAARPASTSFRSTMAGVACSRCRLPIAWRWRWSTRRRTAVPRAGPVIMSWRARRARCPPAPPSIRPVYSPGNPARRLEARTISSSYERRATVSASERRFAWTSGRWTIPASPITQQSSDSFSSGEPLRVTRVVLASAILFVVVLGEFRIGADAAGEGNSHDFVLPLGRG